MKQRLRPQRSVSLLHGIMRIAMISKNSVIAVCTPFTVVSRSSLMSVIITFMFEPAKLQMNCARARGRINLRGDTAGCSESTPSCLPTDHVFPLTTGNAVTWSRVFERHQRDVHPGRS